MQLLTIKMLAVGFAASMAVTGSTTRLTSIVGQTLQTPNAIISPVAPYLETRAGIAFNHQTPIDLWIEKLAWCESKGNPKAVNEDDGGSPSYGLLQYKESTWKMYMKKYGLFSDASDRDLKKLIFDQNLQIKLTKLILAEKNGWKNWYNCVQKLGIAKEIKTIYNHMDGEILSRL